MRRLTFAGFVVALLVVAAPSHASAQASQWRVTPYVGGSIFGEIQNPEAGDTNEFANGFSFGLSSMYRKGRWGVELLGQFTPTEATSSVAFVSSELGDEPEHPFDVDPIFISYLNDLWLMSGSLNLAVFSSDQSWNEERPIFPAREFYAVGGVGVTYFNAAHPAREGLELSSCGGDPTPHCDSDFQGWESGAIEFGFNIGAGVQFNILPDLSIQLELRDHIFPAIERNRSINTISEPPGVDNDPDKIYKRWQNHFVFRQGVTFLWF